MISTKKKGKIQEKKNENRISIKQVSKISTKKKKQDLRSYFFFFYKFPPLALLPSSEMRLSEKQMALVIT